MPYLCTLDYSSLRAGRVAMGCQPTVTKPVVPSHSTITSGYQFIPSTPHQPLPGVGSPGGGQRPTQPHTLQTWSQTHNRV